MQVYILSAFWAITTPSIFFFSMLLYNLADALHVANQMYDIIFQSPSASNKNMTPAILITFLPRADVTSVHKFNTEPEDWLY